MIEKFILILVFLNTVMSIQNLLEHSERIQKVLPNWILSIILAVLTTIVCMFVAD